MSKETMIVFVYDTERLKDEADDPVSAVLYFHPSWVSDTQKVALCGQLMGTSYFLKDCFFKPRILALQNGKFVLKEFGRFILAVGTDRNISDFLLQHRADLLAALVKLFHRDLQTIFNQFATQAQQKNLSEKLYQIFETYLPILQNNGNIFQNVPKLRIPKTASNIFLDAIQTLQCCQQTKGILGGAILYHNKVVASQLNDAVTKQLVLTDPLHIRNPAEHISTTDFHIPNGVQMVVVYVDVRQYRKLQADALRAQNLQTTQLSQGALPFQYAKRKMKRDKSLIFTNIPEESSTSSVSGVEKSGNNSADEGREELLEALPSQRPKSLLTRPTHLPLRFKNMSTKELPESGIASINFDETDSYPEFIGRTSVCSTPMAENKVLQVGNIMSICANPEDENNFHKQKSLHIRQNSLKMDFEKFFQNFIASPTKPIERRNSLTDLQDSLKKISKKLSLKKLSNGFHKKTDVNRNGSGETETEAETGIETETDVETPDYIENDDAEAAVEGRELEAEEPSDNSDTFDTSDNSDENHKTSRTITDPTYPVCNVNGHPISRSLFQELFEKYYKLWDGSAEGLKKNVEIAQLIEEFKDFDNELKKLDASLRQDTNPAGTIVSLKPDRNLNLETIIVEQQQPPKLKPQPQPQPKPKTPLDKRTMSLPLKPMGDAISFTDSVGYRKQPGGIPLTPLMAKLSVLAQHEERTPWDATPSSAGGEIQTPMTTSKVFPRRSSLKYEDTVDSLATLNTTVSSVSSINDGVQKAELYMCGQQNMTLLLLMEEGAAHQQKVVQKMFDICVSKFPHMESHLNQTLNVNVEGDKRDGGYSFMCIDSKWEALQRSGPWNNPVELNTLEIMHRDLQRGADVTDLILRSYDTVFYGYKSGRTEFFYKEPTVQQVSGIPPPSDVMGSIATRAKKRLERDHSYILL